MRRIVEKSSTTRIRNFGSAILYSRNLLALEHRAQCIANTSASNLATYASTPTACPHGTIGFGRQRRMHHHRDAVETRSLLMSWWDVAIHLRHFGIDQDQAHFVAQLRNRFAARAPPNPANGSRPPAPLVACLCLTPEFVETSAILRRATTNHRRRKRRYLRTWAARHRR